ncbi:MAG: trypsin-like peptidase domain-containing protein [Phycisphaerales bacterium]
MPRTDDSRSLFRPSTARGTRVGGSTAFFAAGLAGAGLGLAIAGGGAWSSASAGIEVDPPVRVVQDPAVMAAAENLSQAFENVAATIGPAVVSIDARRTVRRRGGGGLGGVAPGDERSQGGEGSGFIVRSDGYIVTNNHVVDGADRVVVRFSDDRALDAEIVGTDGLTDLAVLKVEGSNLASLAFAGPSDVRIGQWVIAAGNPFGLDSSITAGIVSALGRRQVGINRYEDFIQTDAAINPGNSGGPLVNLRGEVLGVNSAILSRTGGNQGIGLAIPVRIAENVVGQLIESGTVRRGFLGVQMARAGDPRMRRLGFRGAGILVDVVTPGGPAARAGLENEDIISAINGTTMRTRQDLGLAVSQVRPGTTVRVTAFRDGETREFDVVLGELDPAVLARTNRRPAPPSDLGGDEDAPDRPSPAPAAVDPALGFDARPLTPAVARSMDFEYIDSGLLVVRVRRGSPAATADLQARDVIIEADGKPVPTIEAWNEVVAAADREEGVLLNIVRGDINLFEVLSFDR